MIKTFFSKPLYVVITLTCLVVMFYFGVKIFEEVAPKNPKSINEQKMDCLKLGSDYRTRQCLGLIGK